MSTNKQTKKRGSLSSLFALSPYTKYQGERDDRKRRQACVSTFCSHLFNSLLTSTKIWRTEILGRVQMNSFPWPLLLQCPFHSHQQSHANPENSFVKKDHSKLNIHLHKYRSPYTPKFSPPPPAHFPMSTALFKAFITPYLTVQKRSLLSLPCIFFIAISRSTLIFLFFFFSDMFAPKTFTNLVQRAALNAIISFLSALFSIRGEPVFTLLFISLLWLQ